MAERPKLTDDLAALAADERSRLSEPPTAEQLLAYRDGGLPEEEAERIRDRLAIDPEWASIYLDLLRSSDPGAAAGESRESGAADAEVDEAWRLFRAKLDRDAMSEMPPWRRSLSPLLLAAMVVLGLGLGWFLIGRSALEKLPNGKHHVVEVSAALSATRASR